MISSLSKVKVRLHNSQAMAQISNVLKKIIYTIFLVTVIIFHGIVEVFYLEYN